MSHFGWLTEGTIRRNLGADRDLPAAALAAGLQRLQECGWIEHQEAGADSGERDWRLTDRGRDALPAALLPWPEPPSQAWSPHGR
jgi:DNA-binding HxlR family transcriptional regulator